MKKIHGVLFLIVLIASACGDVAIREMNTPHITGWFPIMRDHSVDRSDEPLETGWYHVVDSGKGLARELREDSTYYLHPKPVVTASHFKTMAVESFPYDNTLWQVVVHLDERGRELFAKATEEFIGQDLIFVLDDSLWDEPIRIQAKVASGVIIISKRGRLSKEEAEELRNRIEAGRYL